MKWVRIGKRWPSYEGDVLVTDGYRIIVAWFNVDTGKFQPIFLSDYLNNITHWRTLPALPQIPWYKSLLFNLGVLKC